MEQLREKYGDRNVAFIPVYVREPHAGERGFREYERHRDFDHKLTYAKELVDIKALETPVAVDGMDEAVHAILGDLPNVVYVVDKTGTIVFKSPWIDAAEVDRVLADLVTADDPSHPVDATISTRHLSSAI